jgi:hypothetical protein
MDEEKLNAIICRFEGMLDIPEPDVNDKLENRLIACINRVQESKYLIKQAFKCLGE